ncbi:MAG: OmpA family protein [Sporocytophaga sp.]|uniref:OmpA family protein n=1 Tax=Sporocytophaga sp. TaxID=2231183 RepID=UPI001B1027D9|nr:OmpA family protein [Sporocytophaga sp.]MBO9700149.1 OmpA family protein [Sporocytophaga sp.]
MQFTRNILILSFFLFFSLKSFSQDEKLIKKADKFFEEKNFFQALGIYEQALEQKKTDPYVNFRIAQCYLFTSPKTKALKFAADAVANSEAPTSEMYFLLAQSYQLNHNFDKAIENYKKSDPGNKNKRAISKLITECEYGKGYLKNPVDFKISNAGPIVNTQFQEYLPYITPDLSELYFTSRRTGSTGGKKEYDGLYFEDIYVSQNKGGAWDTPQNMGTPINSDLHDACIGIAPSGETMFIYKSSNGGDIYMSEKKGNQWTKPEPLSINTPFFETSACLSPDERTLYFVRAENFQANRDIYYCSRTLGGKWSVPKKLEGINTPFDEDAPFIHPDGKTLYFSSKGHSTMGGFDIFKSEKTASGGWSAPVNLGYPLNTAGEDVYFVLSANGKIGYYSSDKEGGQGRQDLYSVRMPVSEEPELALLKGTVKDETGKPLDADITITDNSSREVVAKFSSNSANGKYMVALPSGKNYGITIEKKGKLFYSDNVFLSEKDGYKELKNDVQLQSAKSGATVVLKNIFFDSGKSDLRPESTIELQKLVKLLQENPSIKIEISGHTDNTGNADANIALSKTRAQKVSEYLSSSGISNNRLIYKGYGSAKPIADNATEEGRQKNRRTEFKIL